MLAVRCIYFATKSMKRRFYKGNSLLLLRHLGIFQLVRTGRQCSLLLSYLLCCFFSLKYVFVIRMKVRIKEEEKKADEFYMKTTPCWCVHWAHWGLTSVFPKVKEQEGLSQSPGARDYFAQQKEFQPLNKMLSKNHSCLLSSLPSMTYYL